MNFQRLVIVSLSALVFIAAEAAMASSYLLTGHGVLSEQNPPFGVNGEQITLTATLNSADWVYQPVGNPAFHIIVPIAPISLQMVGAVSGPFPNIDKLQRLLALEGANDLIVLENGLPNSLTTVTSLHNTGVNGFDGAAGPFTPEATLALLKSSIDDPSHWPPSFGNVFSGGADFIYFIDNMTWTMVEVPEPGSGALALLGAGALAVVVGMRRQKAARPRTGHEHR